MTFRRRLLPYSPPFLAAAALAFAAAAHAQAPAPADASVAKPSCNKPGDVPGSLASDNQRRSWQREYAAWGDCMKKFITDQQAAAAPYNKAANAAIEEYNSTVKVYNEQIEKLKDAAK